MKKNGLWIWCVGVIILLVGCAGNSENGTFAGRTYSVTVPALVAPPQPVAVEDLFLSPANFLGMNIQVSGQFFPNPKIVCNVTSRPSPAEFSLRVGDAAILAGGNNAQLVNLAPRGLSVLVEGRWRFWRGPVGCGKDESLVELWYLDVAHVLLPNPITAATVTPGAGVVVDIVPTPIGTEISQVIPTFTPTIFAPTSPPLPTLTDTPMPPPTQEPAPTVPPVDTPVVDGTPTLTPIPTFTPIGNTTTDTPDPNTPAVTTPTPDPAGTATPTLTPNPNETATPSPTATEGPSPTATSQTEGSTETPAPTNTPLATADPNGNPIVDMGELDGQDLVAETLAVNEIHGWEYVVDSTDVLTVNVSSPIDVDIVVGIEDPSGSMIALQNNASQGEPEILAGVALNTAGTYRIIVTEKGGNAGSYGMIFQGEDDFAFVFKGTIGFGDSPTTSGRAQEDHFWHFVGEAERSISIVITPNDGSDLFFEIYSPDATLIKEFGEDGDEGTIDEGGNGDPEELLDYELDETGLFAIRIGEFDFQEMNYTIRLTVN